MPENRPAAPLLPRHAALGLVGGAMLLLPLVQALRYQGAEVEALRTERAVLDPMADALALQRGLLQHGRLAHHVLSGRTQFERERRMRQRTVDTHVDSLGRALIAGAWMRAHEESQALAEDWALLAGQVAARRIGVAASADAHRLRVEQVLQVIDLLHLALGRADDPDPTADGGLDAATATLRSLPRLAAQMQALDAPAAGPAGGDVAAEARLQRSLQALQAELARPGGQALAAAGQDATAQTLRWMAHRTAPGIDHAAQADADAESSLLNAALQAQAGLAAAAASQVDAALAQRQSAVQAQRATSLSALAALGCLALWLLRRRPSPPAGGTAADDTAAGPARRVDTEAGRLMQRLRQPVRAGRPAAEPTAPASLPPPD